MTLEPLLGGKVLSYERGTLVHVEMPVGMTNVSPVGTSFPMGETRLSPRERRERGRERER